MDLNMMTSRAWIARKDTRENVETMSVVEMAAAGVKKESFRNLIPPTEGGASEHLENLLRATYTYYVYIYIFYL